MNGRAWLGAGFVAAVAATVTLLLVRLPGARTLAERLADHAAGRRDVLVTELPARPAKLRRGDPVFTVEDQSFALQGRVLEVSDGAPCTVTFEIDSSLTRRLHDGATVVAMHPARNLGWVLRTLVPPALRREVLDQLGGLWETRRKETLDALKPHLLALLGDITSVLADTLPDVLSRHVSEREAFIAAFKDEVYAQHLEPVLKAEVYSRLEKRLGALAGEIGSEIWAAVSVGDLMGVLWTATREGVGAAEENEMAHRLGRLMERKALPVLKRRGPEVWTAAKGAVEEALEQPVVKQAIDRTAWLTLGHPTFQRFIGAVLEEWLLGNPELAARFNEAVRSRALREPLEALWSAAEPLLEEALEEVLTRPDRKGMDHQLVRVLRNVVLKKDKHYLLIIDGGSAPIDPARSLPGSLGEDP